MSQAHDVIDDDINGAVMRLARGIEIPDETMAVEVIDEVCRGPNNFLGHPDTLARMKNEYLYPELFDRATRDDWEAAGKKDIRIIAKERPRNVLETHWPDVDPSRNR